MQLPGEFFLCTPHNKIVQKVLVVELTLYTTVAAFSCKKKFWAHGFSL